MASDKNFRISTFRFPSLSLPFFLFFLISILIRLFHSPSHHSISLNIAPSSFLFLQSSPNSFFPHSPLPLSISCFFLLLQCQSRLQEMKLTGVPISSDEFICYKILHAVLRDNHLELICTLREIPAVQVFTQYLLNNPNPNLVSKYVSLEGPEHLYYVCLSVYSSVCLSVSQSVCLSVSLSACLSVLSVCLFICLSVCLSACHTYSQRGSPPRTFYVFSIYSVLTLLWFICTY